ncbi:MAG: PQQ-dependent sugar dehydrogenase [Acidimicrobiaceae bacterium]|nr:PQQ-dependent sugar dehydrogenase [Acidimicrobiaceae bacterium]MYL04954.1 PQQ-dependent sugar dehydrogenase [Acidimicrobiaceae bacterium]
MPEGTVTRRLCWLWACAAMVAVMAAAGGCAADDDLLSPRPTVPSVTAAPAPTSEPRAEETGTVDPEPAEPRPDGNMFAADVHAEVVLTLDEPIDMAVAPGDDLVWVAERAGLVSRVDMERGEVVETILDITAETRATGEQGLLGIAVADHWLFVNFTDLAGDTRVEAFERDGSGLSGRRRTILTQQQPFRNHNGGDLAIGEDGLLYIGFGDGGSGGDPLNAGQDPTTWLGAVLRIEPTPEGVEPYAIPPDNPFVAADGQDPAGRPEIFLIGVRNPWRFSFDRATGDLWIADVGQDSYEEVTVLLAANGGGLGANLGWRLREGLHVFAGDEPPGHADPVWEYGQDDGCSVTGGFVYRGAAIEDLYGAYVFGDYCTSRLWAVQISTGEVEFRDLGVEVPGGSLASFGEDAQGELYTLSLNGPVARVVPG